MNLLPKTEKKIENQQEEISQTENNDNKNDKKELSMSWFNCFIIKSYIIGIVYIYYILSSLYNLKSASLDEKTIALILIILLVYGIIVFINFYTAYLMYQKKKNGYVFLLILLILDTLTIVLTNLDNFIFAVVVAILAWFLPNCLYFEKRQDVFKN